MTAPRASQKIREADKAIQYYEDRGREVTGVFEIGRD